MQVLIIGGFHSIHRRDSAEPRLSDSKDCTDKVRRCVSIAKAVMEIEAGLVADLVICGVEIDMEFLASELNRIGAKPVEMVQASDVDIADHNQSERNSNDNRWRDATSWLGDENDPLRLGQSLDDLEKAAILQTLTHCGGNRTYAADILGISSRTLRSKLHLYSAEGCTVMTPRVRHTPPRTYSEASGKLLS